MERNLAVVIDFENLVAGCEKEGLGRVDISLVMERFKEKGRILVARSYADWGRFARYKHALAREGIGLVELSSHGGNTKNWADIALVVDAMDLAYTKEYVDTFVVVSGDSDFSPLIMKLKELNKWVIGCGTRGSTSRMLVEASDEFIFYDTLVSGQQSRTRKNKSARSEKLTYAGAAELVTKTLGALIRERDCPVHASILKGAMLRKDPSFSESDLGFESLGGFLEACEEAGLLRLEEDQRGGGYTVGTANPGIAPSNIMEQFEGRSRELYQALREQGKEPLTVDLRRTIFDAVVDDVQSLSGKNQRSTINRVTQHVVRQLKHHAPNVASGQVRALLRDIQSSGLLLHPDGEPVRSPMAPFVLSSADAETLNDTLDGAYVAALHNQGIDVEEEAEAIASLLLGDAESAKRIGELLQVVVESAGKPGEKAA